MQHSATTKQGFFPTGACILLAEDSQLNQRLVSALVRTRGHSLVLADNGKEAITAWGRTVFDLILMDVQMPEMDGFEATAYIRQKEQGRGRVPIVALTAGTTENDQQKCRAAGMDDFLCKPLDPDRLFQTVDRFCSTGRVPLAAAQPKLEESTIRTNEPFNATKLLDRMEGSIEVATELVAIFLSSYPPILQQIAKGIGTGSGREVADLAHKLKGSTANFHAHEAVNLLAEIEARARENDFSDLPILFIKLAAELDRLETALRAFVQTLPE